MHIAIIGNKIIGFIISDIDPDKKYQVYVDELWILKEYQRKGIGKKIMQHIEKLYKNKGIKVIKLVAGTAKGGAFGFYNKLKYKKDKSMVFMEKRLK